MRLLLKVTLYYLVITLFVFGIGGIISFNIFQKRIQIETDRYLISRLWSLESSIENGESPSAFISTKLSIKEIADSFEETRYSFRDTLAQHPNPRIHKLETHRKLKVIRKIAGKTYQIEIFDVIVESDDIFSGVFQSQTRLFIILGVALVVFSFLVSSWLLRPFNVTIQAIKNFRLNDVVEPNLGKTNTKEFKELNQILSRMIRKSKTDYKSLKEFSENASHEMQTPLAVAKGKIELLMQSKNLDEEQLLLINSTYESINHLSKMSRSLSLLTKIENNEFTDLQEINLSEKINQSIFDFQELLELKEIKFDREVEENVIVQSDPVLIQILISNLFQNAIRHNITKGHIFVKLTKEKLTISNAGLPLSTPSDSLFKRFKKDNQSGGTIGLGLAIVKKICDVNNYEISYFYKNDEHVLKVLFDKKM